jgi:hypothetical protein
MSSVKDAISNLDYKQFLLAFWTLDPKTPEEIETLIECKVKFKIVNKFKQSEILNKLFYEFKIKNKILKLEIR